MARKGKGKEKEAKGPKGKGKKNQKTSTEPEVESNDADTQQTEFDAAIQSQPSPVTSPSNNPQQFSPMVESLPQLPDSAILTPEQETISFTEGDFHSPRAGKLLLVPQPQADEEDANDELDGEQQPDTQSDNEDTAGIQEETAPSSQGERTEPEDTPPDSEKQLDSESIHAEAGQGASNEPEDDGPENKERDPTSEDTEEPALQQELPEEDNNVSHHEPEETAPAGAPKKSPVLSPSHKPTKNVVKFAEPAYQSEDESEGPEEEPEPAPPTPRPRRNSSTHAKSHSPSPAERKRKAIYPNVPSPAPLPSPQYPFAHPYNPYSYTHPGLYANGHGHDPTHAATMAVTSAQVYPQVVHSPDTGYQSASPYSPYHYKRGSFSRAYDQYYAMSPYATTKEHMSSHQPHPHPQHQPTREPENSTNGANAELDLGSLLERVQSAIPDMHRLLASVKETQGQLAAREAETQQIHSQHEHSLMQKQFLIDALREQMRKAAVERAEECAKLKSRISELRSELGGLKDRQIDVEESLAEAQKANNDLTIIRAGLLEQIDKLQRSIQHDKETYERELEQQRNHEKEALEEQKEELEGYFQEIKNEDDRAALAREQELLDEKNSLKMTLESEIKALEEAKEKLVADYETGLTAKQSELDATQEALKEKQGELDAAKADIEANQAALDAKQAELDSKQAELDSTQGQLEAKQAEIDGKQSELDAKQEELNAKQVELDTKQGEISEKQSELDAKQEEVEAKQGELDAKQSELETKQSELEAKVSELGEKQKELDEKKAEVESKQAELDGIKGQLALKQTELDSKQEELDTKEAELQAKQAELDDTKQKHVEELAKLREALEEQAKVTKDVEDLLATMKTDHEHKEELWQKAREEFEAQIAQKEEALRQTLEEKEYLAKAGDEREEQINRIVAEMRQTHDNLSKDRERLKKALNSLGEATDMKVKGDSFFLECFDELSRLIVDLSRAYSNYLPIEPSADVIAKIPDEIPTFVDNTPASRELRAAYIQHTVSKILTYRMFQPFLFTLGKRHDKADTFFQTLSTDIRRKSVRREAFWRQQTLKAAYTASNAKQSINVVAAVIVDEIVESIRHFTDPGQLDQILVSVRKIVKLAAETWRLARVERELIAATMPSADDPQTINCEWKEFQYDLSSPTPHQSEGAAAAASGSLARRRPLLCVLPRIVREPCHEDFLTDSDPEKAKPCVYLPGVMLYADSPSVVARKAELAKRVADSRGPSRAATATPSGLNRPSPPRSPVNAVPVDEEV